MFNFLLVRYHLTSDEFRTLFFINIFIDCLVVQLIGARKQAEQFAYRLELNGHRRRLTWEATPRSIHEGVARYITTIIREFQKTHTKF